MDAIVGQGIHAKDVLHHAMNGTINSIIPKLFVPRIFPPLENINGLMTVEQVLTLMGFQAEGDAPAMASTSGSVA
ncbi:hypothetical protein ACET3Z_031229 [Daucus carota]